MPHKSITILCTKEIDEALINEARAKNIFTDILSFIETIPVVSAELQQEIESVATRPATAIFTSVNAVEALYGKLSPQKLSWQLFCTGYATRRAAEKYFGRELISGTADSAAELAELIIACNPPNEVLFFCGDRRRNELPDLLRKNNFAIREMIVYKTVAVPHKIEKAYDGILFFSPSSVQSFFQNNTLDAHTLLFSIGHTTAGEIKNYTSNSIVVSAAPEKQGFFREVIHFFETHSIHH